MFHRVQDGHGNAWAAIFNPEGHRIQNVVFTERTPKLKSHRTSSYDRECGITVPRQCSNASPAPKGGTYSRGDGQIFNFTRIRCHGAGKLPHQCWRAFKLPGGMACCKWVYLPAPCQFHLWWRHPLQSAAPQGGDCLQGCNPQLYIRIVFMYLFVNLLQLFPPVVINIILIF